MSKTKTFGSHLVDLSLMHEGGCIIDAGTCQGNFIKDIRKHVNPCFIIGVEPNKSNQQYLRDMNFEDVVVIEAALVGSKEPKIMKFNEFAGLPEWGNVTGLYQTKKHITYDVETLDLRELLGVVPCEYVDLLKMDIEGNEHQVVQDMTKAQAERIQQITMEVHNGLQGMMAKLEWLGYTTEFTNGELYAVR